MTIVKDFESISNKKDFERNSKWGCGVFLHPRVVEADWQLYQCITKARAELPQSPAVGDIITSLNGQGIVSIEWPNHLQVCDYGSFSVHEDGRMSMSGGCGPSKSRDFFKPTNKTGWIKCWYFSEGIWGAHRGCETIIQVKVWELNEALEVTSHDSN